MTTQDQQSLLEGLGAAVVHLVAAERVGEQAGSSTAIDVDGVVLAHVAETGHVALLLRPGHYVFGLATTLHETPDLIRDLREQLSACAQP